MASVKMTYPLGMGSPSARRDGAFGAAANRVAHRILELGGDLGHSGDRIAVVGQDEHLGADRAAGPMSPAAVVIHDDLHRAGSSASVNSTFKLVRPRRM